MSKLEGSGRQRTPPPTISPLSAALTAINCTLWDSSAVRSFSLALAVSGFFSSSKSLSAFCETPDRCARSSWLHPSRARAALIKSAVNNVAMPMTDRFPSFESINTYSMKKRLYTTYELT